MFDHEPIDQLSSGDIRMVNIACENFENLWASRSKNTMHPDLIEMLDQSQLKSAEQPEIARKALCLPRDLDGKRPKSLCLSFIEVIRAYLFDKAKKRCVCNSMGVFDAPTGTKKPAGDRPQTFPVIRPKLVDIRIIQLDVQRLIVLAHVWILQLPHIRF